MGQGVAWVMAQQAEEEGGRGSGSIRRRGKTNSQGVAYQVRASEALGKSIVRG